MVISQLYYLELFVLGETALDFTDMVTLGMQLLQPAEAVDNWAHIREQVEVYVNELQVAAFPHVAYQGIDVLQPVVVEVEYLQVLVQEWLNLLVEEAGVLELEALEG